MISLLRHKIPETIDTPVDGLMVAVTVRISGRARNYRLSVPHHGRPVLTVPRQGRWPEAQAFLRRQSGWLAARLNRAPAAVAFEDGAEVPLRGMPHRIVATGRVRGRVELSELDGEPLLLVPGAPEHRARRLTDWLKSEADRDLKARVALHAKNLGVAVKSLRLRGQATRWGSCSSSGALNFNWRLILAPAFVLDYVAAHEVAHLVEMNHSRAFWDTLKRTCPDMERGRAWLKTHGRELMVQGLEGA
jgi:predicted metal-dependent hydrolase